MRNWERHLVVLIASILMFVFVGGVQAWPSRRRAYERGYYRGYYPLPPYELLPSPGTYLPPAISNGTLPPAGAAVSGASVGTPTVDVWAPGVGANVLSADVANSASSVGINSSRGDAPVHLPPVGITGTPTPANFAVPGNGVNAATRLTDSIGTSFTVPAPHAAGTVNAGPGAGANSGGAYSNAGINAGAAETVRGQTPQGSGGRRVLIPLQHPPQRAAEEVPPPP